MLQMRFVHRCMPYCMPDEGQHTDLVYSDEEVTEETIQRMLAELRGLKVVRTGEEPDAPPKIDPSRSKPWAKAWLVTWLK